MRYVVLTAVLALWLRIFKVHVHHHQLCCIWFCCHSVTGCFGAACSKLCNVSDLLSDVLGTRTEHACLHQGCLCSAFAAQPTCVAAAHKSGITHESHTAKASQQMCTLRKDLTKEKDHRLSAAQLPPVGRGPGGCRHQHNPVRITLGRLQPPRVLPDPTLYTPTC
jgi:hypothetical protein